MCAVSSWVLLNLKDIIFTLGQTLTKKSQTPAKKMLQVVMFSFFITQLLGLRKLSDRLGNSCNRFSQLDHNLRVQVFDNVTMKILYVFLVPQK